MGLDCYVYEITRPTGLEDRTYQMDEILDRGFTAILMDEMNDPDRRDLLPYIAKVQVQAPWLSLERIRGAYRLGSEADIGCLRGDGGITVCEHVDGKAKFVDIPAAEVRGKFLDYRVNAYAVFRKEMIAYWCKDYEVADFFRSRIENLQNMGYYRLSPELLAEFNATFKTDLPEEDHEEISGIFYWEWY